MMHLAPELQSRFADDAFDSIIALEGELFRSLENRKTLRFTVNHRDYFAKLHHGVGWREIIKNLIQLRLPILGAKNEYLAIERLHALGLATQTCVGYGVRGYNPARQESFILTQALNQTRSLEEITKDWLSHPPTFAFKHALIQEVARIARCLHQNGVNHRDFYLCHFLFAQENDAFTLYLIDLHRAQLRKKTPLRWIVKDLSGLYFSSMHAGLTSRDLLRFIRYYSQKSLKEILKDNTHFWSAVSKRAHVLYEKTETSIQHRWSQYLVCQKSVLTNNLQHCLDDIEKQYHSPHTSCLKHDATTTVIKICIDNRWLVVKRYNIKSYLHALRRAFRTTRAEKCWKNAQILERSGIATPKPIAYIEKRCGILRSTAYFISEYIESIDAAAYFKTAHPMHSEMANRIMHLIKKLSYAKISHGDLKATNILITDHKVYLIDLDGMQQSPQRFERARQRDVLRFMKNWHALPEIKALFLRNTSWM